MSTGSLPGPRGWAAVRAVPALLRGDPLRFLMHLYRRYGPVASFGLGPLRPVMMVGPAANRHILVDAADNFVVAPLYDRLHARWLVGDGLIFIDDPAHRRIRRLLLPAFHRGRIVAYHDTMLAATADMLAGWAPGRPFDFAAAMHYLTLRIMARTLFGIDLTTDVTELSRHVAMLARGLSPGDTTLLFAQVPFDIPGIGIGGSIRRAQRALQVRLDAIVAAHEQRGTDTHDVVSLLTAARDEDGSRLTPHDIRENLLTLFFAGHETSANALTWAAYLLARHPAVVARLQAEIDVVLGGAPPRPADFERLPYLEMVVKEVLRLFPPLPVFYRVARESFTWEGYTVPAGAFVIYSPFVSHRIGGVFPDPGRFRPERFDPAARAPPPGAYIPFGAGSRSCIGAPFALLEIKTILVLILQQFRLAPGPGPAARPVVRGTLQPRDGLSVTVAARAPVGVAV